MSFGNSALPANTPGKHQRDKPGQCDGGRFRNSCSCRGELYLHVIQTRSVHIRIEIQPRLINQQLDILSNRCTPRSHRSGVGHQLVRERQRPLFQVGTADIRLTVQESCLSVGQDAVGGNKTCLLFEVIRNRIRSGLVNV